MRFDLPYLSMLSGTSKDIRISLYTKTKQPFSLADAVAYFSLTPFVNASATPLLRKQCAILQSNSNNIAVAELLPSETRALSGRFIYQFTIQREATERDAIQGCIDIYPNTDKESVL